MTTFGMIALKTVKNGGLPFGRGAVRVLIQQVVFAKNREKLVAATRALDRVRLSYAKRSSVYRNSTPHIRVPSTMIRVRSRCIERVRVALSRLAGLLCRQQ